MKYYFIKNNRDPKITRIRSGASPGRIIASIFQEQLWLDEFLYGKDSGLRAGDFPDQDFKLEEVPLDKKARNTDFISVGAILNGFVVNEKVKSILQICQLLPHKYYKVIFDQAGTKVEGYYWLYFNLLDGSKHINYHKSVFDTVDEEIALGHKVIIQNYEDYIHFTKAMGRAIHVEKIVFDETFNSELDLFGMRFWGGHNYISDRLKKKLEENGVKGYKLYYPPSDPILEWE